MMSEKLAARCLSCAMKTAATASYSAVPFMLTVVPRGSMKLVTRLLTPKLFSKLRIVTGSVAALLGRGCVWEGCESVL